MTNRIIKSRGSLIRGRIISRFLRRVPDSLIIREGRRWGGEGKNSSMNLFLFFFCPFLLIPSQARKQKFLNILNFWQAEVRRNERKSEKLCEQFFPPLIKDSFLKRSTLAKYPASTFAALISYSSPKFDSFGGGRKGERVSLSTIVEKRGIKEGLTLYR